MNEHTACWFVFENIIEFVRMYFNKLILFSISICQ